MCATRVVVRGLVGLIAFVSSLWVEYKGRDKEEVKEEIKGGTERGNRFGVRGVLRG